MLANILRGQLLLCLP